MMYFWQAGVDMGDAAERMRAMRDRRRARGLREVRLVVPDPSSHAVRQRIATQVAALNDRDENDALSWIEAVSDFDEPDVQARNATR